MLGGCEFAFGCTKNIGWHGQGVHGFDEAVGGEVGAGFLCAANECIHNDVAVHREHCRVVTKLGFVFVRPKRDRLGRFVKVRMRHGHGGVHAVHGLAAEFVNQVGISRA